MELKELVEFPEMTERMNAAFSDLRADFELSINASAEKIKELRETNVDIDNHLQNLVTYSTNSSGIISGLRGTGKTHLMLLARSAINEKFLNEPTYGTFCIYLGSAEKVKFSGDIRNGGKKVAYVRGLASNKFLSESIWHTDIQSSYIGLPQNRRFYGKTIDSGVVLLLEKARNQKISTQNCGNLSRNDRAFITYSRFSADPT